MPYQNIQATLSGDDADNIALHLQAIRELLPFLINLTKEERGKGGGLGRDRYAFLMEARDIARNNPGLLPPVFDMAGWEADIALHGALRQLLQQVSSLHEALDDTVLALRIESQGRAADVRDYVKQAAKREVPGMDVLVARLKAADGQ